jgi:hypothetical protein
MSSKVFNFYMAFGIICTSGMALIIWGISYLRICSFTLVKNGQIDHFLVKIILFKCKFKIHSPKWRNKFTANSKGNLYKHFWLQNWKKKSANAKVGVDQKWRHTILNCCWHASQLLLLLSSRISWPLPLLLSWYHLWTIPYLETYRHRFVFLVIGIVLRILVSFVWRSIWQSGRVDIWDPSEGKMLQLLQEILALVGRGAHHLL